MSDQRIELGLKDINETQKINMVVFGFYQV